MNSCVLQLLLIWMRNNAENICRKVGKKLRRPSLHAFILLCGIKSARMAPSKTLTDSYTQLLPKAQHHLKLMTRTPKSQPNNMTLPKYTVLIHWWVVHTIFSRYWSSPCLITLLSSTPTKSHRWAIPNPSTLFRYTQFFYIAEVNRNSIHGRTIPNPNLLLSYNLS